VGFFATNIARNIRAIVTATGQRTTADLIATAFKHLRFATARCNFALSTGGAVGCGFERHGRACHCSQRTHSCTPLKYVVWGAHSFVRYWPLPALLHAVAARSASTCYLLATFDILPWLCLRHLLSAIIRSRVIYPLPPTRNWRRYLERNACRQRLQRIAYYGTVADTRLKHRTHSLPRNDTDACVYLPYNALTYYYSATDMCSKWRRLHIRHYMTNITSGVGYGRAYADDITRRCCDNNIINAHLCMTFVIQNSDA